MWKRLSHLTVALACVAAVANCSKSVPESELVAKVNGEGITKVEFEAMVERNMARYRGNGHALPPGIETRIRESVLRRMVDDEVIELKAKDVGVVIGEADLAAKFKEHKDRFRTEEAFQDYLKRSNNTEDNMKEDLRRNMLRDMVVEKLSGAIDVNDEEINKYFTDNKQRFIEKEQVKAARILVRAELKPGASPADTKSAEKKAEAAAKDAFKKASANGADFGAVAAELSVGAEKSRRGELGWLTRGRMAPEFDNVAFTLKPGEVSKPLQTKEGWEIIKVSEKREEKQRDLESVKENIKNSLLARKRNEKRREVLRDLKKTATVEHLIKFDAPYAAAAGHPDMKNLGPRRPLPGQPMMPEGMPGRAMMPDGAGEPAADAAVDPSAAQGAAEPAPGEQPATVQ